MKNRLIRLLHSLTRHWATRPYTPGLRLRLKRFGAGPPVKVISASLWGTDPKYLVGARRNAVLWKEFFPGWQFRIYHDASVPAEVLRFLEESGVELIARSRPDAFCGMFWRFEINDDLGVDKYIIRDLDSRFSVRDRAAVEQWLASGKPFHVIRDSRHHQKAIMGGMWGGTPGYFAMRRQIARWGRYDYYDCDQQMLEESIWPRLQTLCHVNDQEAGLHPLPPNPDGTHLGQIFEADETPVWR